MVGLKGWVLQGTPCSSGCGIPQAPQASAMRRSAQRRSRTSAGLTQAELAERTGRSRSTIARWELGEMEPPYNAVMHAVAACGREPVVGLAAPDASYLGDIGERRRLDPLERLRALRGDHQARLLLDLAEAGVDAIVIGDAAGALHGWPLLLTTEDAVQLCVRGHGLEDSRGVETTRTPAGTRGFADLRRDSEEMPVGAGHLQVASPLDLLRMAIAAGHQVQITALEALLEHRRRWPDGLPPARVYSGAEARDAVDAWLISR